MSFSDLFGICIRGYPQYKRSFPFRHFPFKSAFVVFGVLPSLHIKFGQLEIDRFGSSLKFGSQVRGSPRIIFIIGDEKLATAPGNIATSIAQNGQAKTNSYRVCHGLKIENDKDDTISQNSHKKLDPKITVIACQIPVSTKPMAACLDA